MMDSMGRVLAREGLGESSSQTWRWGPVFGMDFRALFRVDRRSFSTRTWRGLLRLSACASS